MGKTDKTEKDTKKQRHFWKDFKAELKKVIWPTRSQVVNNTIIVLVIVVIITAIVFVLDLAFEALNTYGIDKLKTLVQNSVVSDDVNTAVEETPEDSNIAEDIEAPDDVANVENVS